MTIQYSDMRYAFDLINEVILISDEVPEPGEEFAASITDKVGKIERYIQNTNNVTEAQIEALENMRDGLLKWIK